MRAPLIYFNYNYFFFFYKKKNKQKEKVVRYAHSLVLFIFREIKSYQKQNTTV